MSAVKRKRGKKTYNKVYVDKSVYDLTLERMRLLYKRYDTVVISFSGGKDSTCLLQCAITVAKEMNRLPVQAFFWDEEAIYSETVEYMERVRAMPEVELKWLTLPCKHRNGCSRREPYWYPWDPDKEHLWVREKPKNTISIEDLPGFTKDFDHTDGSYLLYPAEQYGMVAHCLGIRTQESMRRLRVVLQSKEDNWISFTGNPTGPDKNCVKAFPIYDWMFRDVWFAPWHFKWDYNRVYDAMEQAGLNWPSQRVSPPFGEEPMQILYLYQLIEPQLWDKMTRRVKGAATASRYSNTELYGNRMTDDALPPGMNWKDMFYVAVEKWNPAQKKALLDGAATLIGAHTSRTTRPVPDSASDPLTGLSWKQIAKQALRGDFKNRLKSTLNNKGEAVSRKLGLSLDEMLEIENQEYV